MGKTGELIGSVLIAVVGVAIIAVLVGQNSQTSSVLQSFFSGFGSILQVAVSPVTGSRQQ